MAGKPIRLIPYILDILGVAWMGGTIATGAVAAAGAFLSEEALYTEATIKWVYYTDAAECLSGY